jgi:UDP-glucose 4-epimerase
LQLSEKIMIGAKIKILILGGNGFIGKNIIESYNLEKEYVVLSPRRKELNILDTVSVESYMRVNLPDVVIHSAVNIQSLDQNIQMYFNVSRCKQYFGKLITLGSGAEYDMRNYVPMMTEDYFLRNIPADIYGLSKFIAANDINESKINAVNLRGFGIFGKYEDYTRRFISNNICRAICGLDITLHKKMKFDYLYVNDIVNILKLFIENDVHHKNYNICSSQHYDLLELANMIAEIHGDESTKVIVREKGIKPEYTGDNSRFINEFGSFEFTDMKESIRDLYKWYETSVDLEKYCEELQSGDRT